MKKFIMIVSTIVCLVLAWNYGYYHLGIYIDLSDDTVTTFTKTDEDTIYMNKNGVWEAFEIKGMNMGSGEPGQWSTDFDIDKDTYLRWFAQMQEMGVNTLRIYTIQADDFYNAFYEYNKDNPDPLWLIQGVWVNDYVQNSHRDAYSADFYDTFLEDCRIAVDVIHGRRKINLGRMASAGSGTYNKDISNWVIGYILGVEWEDVTVVYTNDKYKDREGYNAYKGEYMYTSAKATPFEAMLAMIGDHVLAYESERYGTQRLIAFSNWVTTDPFDYPVSVTDRFMKCAKVDVEHIKTTEKVLSGQFASYHVYPYYQDYLHYVDDWRPYGINDPTEFLNEDGELNTYRAYLSMLTAHHDSMPVVISEFGVSTGRGIAQVDQNTGRNQGHMSEQEQGQALVECYEDIKAVGCAGSCVFSWQDEWFKRTWNTMHAVNLMRTPYWSDYQTNEQYFGLLSFDPGDEECVCYVDGDISEWTQEDKISEDISIKYDERFIYFLVHKTELDFENETLYVPMDVTPKSGSSYCENYGLLFDRACDFLLVIDGKNNSRLLVQERYEVLRSTYAQDVYEFDTYAQGRIPDVDSPEFVDINLILQTQIEDSVTWTVTKAETFNTGKLTYGNANPESADFNSLADFIQNGDYIEIKLPWQLLNFSDPSRMTIHDDYYDDNYGIEYITIDEMYVGLSVENANGRINLNKVLLEGWGNDVTYHERLKPSYYIMQSIWRDEQ